MYHITYNSNISSLKCLKLTRHVLYILLSCVLEHTFLLLFNDALTTREAHFYHRKMRLFVCINYLSAYLPKASSPSPPCNATFMR